MVTKVQVVAPVDLGRGIVRNDKDKKFEVDLTGFVDGDTITYENGKLKGRPQQSGLDCAAIGALKTVSMDKTVTVLGKKGNECVQVAVLDSIFQDVGVGISANKYSGFVGDRFNVKITVSNTGEGTNENTTLSIIKPLLGSYTIQNQTHTSQGAGGVNKVSDTEYHITNLAKGGTVVVTFDVVSSSHGTYQFSATVDPQSALDTNAINHRATISLNINTTADAEYVATEDCPAIVVTDVALSKELMLQSTGGVRAGTFKEVEASKTNLYEGPISNRKFRLDGASTVVVINTTTVGSEEHRFLTTDDGAPAHIFHMMQSRSIMNRDYQMSPTTANPFGDTRLVSSSYTFNDGILTITDPSILSAVIAMRPAGSNCRWQYFSLASTSSMTEQASCDIKVSGTSDFTKQYTYDISGRINGITRSDTRTVDTNKVVYDGRVLSIRSVSDLINFSKKVSSLVIRAKKQTEKVITLVDSCQDVSKFVSRGAVEFSPSDTNNLTITVHQNALPTDSVTFGVIALQVID